MSLEELVFDAWTPMSFKRALGDRRIAGRAWTAPTWVGDHGRRLQAYSILQSYIDNASRHFLQLMDEEKRAEHREYGDAALLRNQILSALLGEEQRIVVEGANVVESADEDDGEEQEESEEDREARQALELQDWMQQWGIDEQLLVKIVENERSAVTFGDGVYVLGWSESKQRPRLRVYDPGFYFPVLDDGAEDEFPTKVHIAWEIEDDDVPGVQVRRITYELVRTEEPRRYPWNEDPTEWTVLLTDAIWTLEGGANVEDLTGATAEYLTTNDGEELDGLDLNIDFIPVVHVSNTVALQEHYGRSALAYVLQILDDLANADTDLQAASATTGTPPVALGGVTMDADNLVYGPGTVFGVGDGRMDVLDTSRSLDALIKYVSHLLDRLSENARTPAAALGRVDASDVPSGIALQLSFGPMVNMVREMRLARENKYQLLLKFVWRLALAGDMPDVPEQWHKATVEFGSFLPSDQSATIKAVVELLERKAISLQTGVTMLLDAGLPIESVAQEVKNIESRDFEGANQLLDATGSQQDVAEYLNRQQRTEVPQPPTPEPPQPPGTTPPPTPSDEPGVDGE